LTTADPQREFLLLAVHLVDGQPRLAVREPSGALVELRSTALGPARRVLGELPSGIFVNAVSSSANGNLLVVGETFLAPHSGRLLWIAHGRPGRQLHVSEVLIRGDDRDYPAAAVTTDGRGLILTGGASTGSPFCPLAVLAVQRDGRVGAPRCIPLSFEWVPQALAAAATSSGKAILGAVAVPGLRAQTRVFAWSVGLDGRHARRRTVARGAIFSRVAAGIDAVGRGLLAWDVFAARVP
jgi:hypothetical protein